MGDEAVVAAYVDRLVEEGIELAAVTDYNGVRREWFEPIRDRAAERGIVVLPGVELSFTEGKYGLHVLAVFEADLNLDALDRFLVQQDRQAVAPLVSASGHRDIQLRGPVLDSLAQLRAAFSCVLILPHPDQKNGFCKTYQPGEAASFVRQLLPDAIEHLAERDHQKLCSTAVLDAVSLDRIARVEFSDPKSLEEIGTKRLGDGTPRTTYIKLSTLNLDALALALGDPETRVRLGSPPAVEHARITRMAVDGSGFLGKLEIAFNDDLNVIIGGRGTGKSAVLETLRYAFGLRSYADQSYREDLVRHALGSGGQVTVDLERPLGGSSRRRYRVSRVLGSDPRVVEIETNAVVDLPPGELLGPSGGPTIFGQREIFAVSDRAPYRIALLDELIGEDARARGNAVAQALERLGVNGRTLQEVRRRLERREELRERLRSVEHELVVYEQHGAASKLREASRLRSDGQYLGNASVVVGEIATEWGRQEQSLVAPLATARRSLARGESQHKAVLAEADRALARLEADLRGLLDQGRQAIGKAQEELASLQRRWRALLEPLEQEINRIKQEAQSDRLDPDRLLTLNAEKARLLPLIEDLDRVVAQEGELREQREELLRQVQDRRLAEHRLRRERAQEISALLEDRVRLRVELKGQKEEYRERVAALLKGAGVTTDAQRQLVAPENTDGIELAKAIRAGEEEAQERFGLSPAMAARLVQWFRDDEQRLLELETLIPDDRLDVLLEVDGDYRPLAQLSAGQRATAILLLLFALEGRVLVLDQPEDDLDNRFVYHDVVELLRRQKGSDGASRRQVIVASHNANIPVVGDAELVLPLEVREGHARVLQRASIDDAETRSLVKEIMEGGDEAFRRRAEKYGGLRGREWT